MESVKNPGEWAIFLGVGGWRPISTYMGCPLGRSGLYGKVVTPLVLQGRGSLFHLILCFPPCSLERKTVPLFPHPPVPSLSTSESKPPPQLSPPTSPVRTPLEVRLFPQLQTYVPYRPHPPQLRKVTSPLQSPTKAKPKVVSIDDHELSAIIFSLGDDCLSLPLGQLLLEEKLLGKPGKMESARVLS